MSVRRSLVVLAVPLVIACGGGRAPSAPAREPQGPAPVPPSGPHVPAGARMEIELLDALATDTSVPGQRFRALVNDDLIGPGGDIVATRGAVVYGTVARVGQRPVPLLAVDLEVVRTAYGDAPIAAKLLGAEPVALGDDDVYDPATSSYDAVFTPRHPPGAGGYAAPGESVAYQDYYDERARVLRLPVGAVLAFVLEEPLVPGRSAR